MSIVVIDYGMSNLGSITRALEECGASVIVSEDPKSLKTAEKIVLPGVGAFGDGMKNLNERGWSKIIREEVAGNKIPMLGICLGMQLLASKSYEGGEFEGLNLIEGEVVKFIPKNNERVPHVGWNEITKTQENVLFKNIESGADFYFVHSYYFKAKNTEDIIATTDYCGEFASAVSRENVYGTQFHPEKSVPIGFQVLKNFINL